MDEVIPVKHICLKYIYFYNKVHLKFLLNI